MSGILVMSSENGTTGLIMRRSLHLMKTTKKMNLEYTNPVISPMSNMDSDYLFNTTRKQSTKK